MAIGDNIIGDFIFGDDTDNEGNIINPIEVIVISKDTFTFIVSGNSKDNYVIVMNKVVSSNG